MSTSESQFESGDMKRKAEKIFSGEISLVF